jgi:acyl-CoA thioesterase-1
MLKILKILYLHSLIISLCFACRSNNSQEQTTTATQQAADTASTGSATRQDPKTILFFGNSLTAGYGLEPLKPFLH